MATKNIGLTYPDTHHDVTANTLFGFWIYLMTDFILFATFFATYAVLYNAPLAHQLLSLPHALFETLILLVSSFTCGMALLSIPRSKNKTVMWFGATFILGVAFMVMEIAEFSELLRQGHSWEKSAYLSSFFTLIGAHGLHIALGLLFMLVFVGQLIHKGFTLVTIRRLTCLSLFWFFSYVVWIFMFTIVYLIGAA